MLTTDLSFNFSHTRDWLEKAELTAYEFVSFSDELNLSGSSATGQPQTERFADRYTETSLFSGELSVSGPLDRERQERYFLSLGVFDGLFWGNATVSPLTQPGKAWRGNRRTASVGVCVCVWCVCARARVCVRVCLCVCV